MKNRVICADYDSMGNFSRFPTVEVKKERKNILWYIKKLFFFSFFIVLVSCGSLRPKDPTSQLLVDLWNIERETGIKHFIYKDRIVTETELDSLISLEVDSAIEKMFKL